MADEQQVDNVETEVDDLEEAAAEEEITDDPTEDGDEDQEPTETKDDDAELEDWQKDEDSTEEKEVTYPKSLKAKKRLKGELEVEKTENERLRQENEALKTQKPTAPTELKCPTLLDFDTDEEFHAALAQYNLAVFKADQQKDVAVEQERKAKESIQQGADAHYERADKLMESSGIAPEKYKAADAKLRQTAEAVLPNQGNVVIDILLGKLGEGSEKVGYYIGNNETARAKFHSLLAEDPTGMEAAMYLGEQKNRLNNNPRKKTSKARPPAPTASGDAKQSPTGASLRKKYDALHKKDAGGEAFKVKRQAKKAGIDVSKWIED